MADIAKKSKPIEYKTLYFSQDELKIISAIIIQSKFSLIDAQAVTPIYMKFRNAIKEEKKDEPVSKPKSN